MGDPFGIQTKTQATDLPLVPIEPYNFSIILTNGLVVAVGNYWAYSTHIKQEVPVLKGILGQFYLKHQLTIG